MFRLRSLFSSKPIARRVTLPPELYTCIFYFVSDRRDLCALCTVSQAFRHLAEPFLYRSVDLSYNHRNIRAWFERIGSNPHLAKFVRSVTFGIVFSQMPTPAVPLLKIIAHGLNSLVNLKELTLHKKSSRFLPHFYAWILDGHPFQLRSFHNEMFDLEPTLPFLASQRDITVWHQLDATPCELPNDLLPNLIEVAVAPWILPTLTSSSIVWISTILMRVDETIERQFADGLRCNYSRTLTSLTLQRTVIDENMDLADFFVCLAENLPLVERLSLWHRGERETDSSVQGTASSASRFTRLATLSLLPHRSLNTDSVYKNVLTAKDERRTAACFFKTVPSLIRITFPVSIAKAEESLWYARSREVAVAQDVVIEKTKSWKG